MIDLAEIRKAAGLTQKDIAAGLGMTDRSTVSQVESRSDWLVSSVKAYIEAAGATAELVVKVNGHEIKFSVA